MCCFQIDTMTRSLHRRHTFRVRVTRLRNDSFYVYVSIMCSVRILAKINVNTYHPNQCVRTLVIRVNGRFFRNWLLIFNFYILSSVVTDFNSWRLFLDNTTQNDEKMSNDKNIRHIRNSFWIEMSTIKGIE